MKLYTPLLLWIILLGCSTTPPTYDTSITVDRYFRYAQDARDAEKYARAMQYYDIIIANFNDRPDKVLVAEYEKAYVYYLEKKYTTSLDHLQVLLGKIQATDPRIVPPALGSLIGLLAEKNEKKLKKGSPGTP
jgi:hypothetical protein